MTPRSTGDVLPDRAALAAFAGVVLFGGANAIAVKQTVFDLAPFWGAAVRFAAAGLIMVAVVVLRRRSFPRGASLAGAAIFGAIGLGASYSLIYPSLLTTPAGTVMVLIALSPLLTFGLAIVHRLERFRAQGLLGALVALGGIVVVFADQASADVPVVPLLMVLLGTVCIAESGVILKLIPRSDPFGTNAVAMLTAAALLLLLSLLASEQRTLPAQTTTWLALGYLIALGTVAMFALYVFALQRWTASAVSYTTLLFPLVTVPLAVALVGERITPAFLLGGAVILVGVYVGAFLKIRPRAHLATSLPECLSAEQGARGAAG